MAHWSKLQSGACKEVGGCKIAGEETLENSLGRKNSGRVIDMKQGSIKW